jgi:hypothetical protein
MSGRCLTGRCAPLEHCENGVLDPTEVDIDCGGTCPLCAGGKKCTAAGDCKSSLCHAGACLSAGSCTDGILDQDESDVDCGGGCPPCPTGSKCGVAGDCATQICTAGTCRTYPCQNGTKDNDETDVDCGGSCSPCADGLHCLQDGDCNSGVCKGGACQTQTMTCPNGYKQDPGNQLCVCDPATCGACCNTGEDNLCGHTNVVGKNNCGSRGQQCFRCDKGDLCVTGDGPDYCASPCAAGPCAGCCTIDVRMQLYCRHGDTDGDCGGKGQQCVACPPGSHCVNHKCQ